MVIKSSLAALASLSVVVSMDSVFYDRFIITPLEFARFNVVKVHHYNATRMPLAIASRTLDHSTAHIHFTGILAR